MMTKPLSYLADRFRWLPFKWDVERNDEYSGSGDGRVWQAQLAPPLWTATVQHAALLNTEAEELDAVIRSLNGAQEPFLLRSPLFCGPKSDPDGSIIEAHTVLIASIINRRSITLSGFPAGYALTSGDKFSVVIDPGNPTELQPWLLSEGAWDDAGFWHDSKTWAGAASNLKYSFHEVSASAVADAGGVVDLTVFPSLPLWVLAGVAVRLNKPACRVFIVPGSYSVGAINGRFTAGGSFKVVQKK